MDLHKLAERHGANKTNPAVRHYLDAYREQFQSSRHRVMRLLEIGVQSGGSLRMWAEYFPEAEIHGVDCDPGCLAHAGSRLNIHIGRQEDESFLRETVIPNGPFDVIIDDGGHTTDQQWNSLIHLWPALYADGTYVIEDLHTSYTTDHGARESVVQKLNRVIEGLHAAPTAAYAEAKGLRGVDCPATMLADLWSVHVYGCLYFLHKSP